MTKLLIKYFQRICMTLKAAWLMKILPRIFSRLIHPMEHVKRVTGLVTAMM
jgi:hypothetical protein